MSHFTNPRFFYRRARNGKGWVLEVGRYRQEFWKPLVRETQHGLSHGLKPLLHKGRKP
ncbi:hypothetical protein ADIAG_02384 [Paeniglutamicibacter gangotriensis Lz1y]|uniref:Uncharacterized protein n=1 Tax=Paeniglutamicibacter gangotriensis Lz1y TaxID=1276920 RepID=M7MTV9_9MICC|nr:hypothetical protein ADIAG_02384 [Paeniglutamicibacter gangotriensis Lz1y]